MDKKYKRFNIFTKDGVNRNVKTDKPMTVLEAQYHFNALCCGPDE